jgi:hypothetical protein
MKKILIELRKFIEIHRTLQDETLGYFEYTTLNQNLNQISLLVGDLESLSELPDNDTKICKWKSADFGMFGCESYEYITSCSKNYDCDKVNKENYCPNCGGKIV